MKKEFKIFSAYVLIAVVTILSAEAVFWTRGYGFIDRQSALHSMQQAELLGDIYIAGGYADAGKNQDFAEKYAKKYGIRITLIDRLGNVAADSSLAPSKMENHKDREEVQRALKGEPYTTRRKSYTLGMNYSYTAIPIVTPEFDGVLRVSLPLEALTELNIELAKQVVLSLLLCFLGVVGFAALLSRRQAEEQSKDDKEAKTVPQTLPFPDRNFRRGMEDIEQIDSIVINKTTRMVTVGKRPVSLSKKEFELLCLMASNRGRVFSRELLLEKIWGYDYCGETRTVDVHIRNLRKKIENDSEHPEYILTVRGYGYKFK